MCACMRIYVKYTCEVCAHTRVHSEWLRVASVSVCEPCGCPWSHVREPCGCPRSHVCEQCGCPRSHVCEPCV